MAKLPNYNVIKTTVVIRLLKIQYIIIVCISNVFEIFKVLLCSLFIPALS